MQYIAGVRDFTLEYPTVVTLGKFDGLHRGHRKLLDAVFRYREKGYRTAVFTFQTAPGTLIKGKLQQMITTNEERRDNLEKAGVDYLVEYPFNEEVAHTAPEDFVRNVLVGQMKAKAIVTGPDFRFGYKRSGDTEYLRKMAPVFGYEYEMVDKLMDGDREISSTYIREELAAGHIRKANELLGYTYSVRGTVVHGKRLGRTLGFPTANIEPGIQKHLPTFGVYLSETVVGDRVYDSLSNIGRKPTVSPDLPVGVETYIYGTHDDIYGKEIEVRMLDFFRPEMKFESIEALQAQVLSDKEKGRIMHEERKKQNIS